MVTAVHLDQHAFPGHTLAAHPVLGRTPSPRTAQPGVDQDTPQGGPADVDAVSIAQQLAQMGVVSSLVLDLGQVHHVGDHRIGCGVGGPAAPVAVRKYAYAEKPPTEKLSAEERAKLMALRKSTTVVN